MRSKVSVSSRLYISFAEKPMLESVSADVGMTVSPAGSAAAGVGVGSSVAVGETAGVGEGSALPPGLMSPEKIRISSNVSPASTARKIPSTMILRMMYFCRRTAWRLFLLVCFRLANFPSPFTALPSSPKGRIAVTAALPVLCPLLLHQAPVPVPEFQKHPPQR